MTTYKTTTYETTEALREAINSELSALAYPYTVKHKIYGEGQLTFVTAPLTGSTIFATVDFAVGTKTLSMDMVFANNLLKMPEMLTDILLEAQTAFKADFAEREQAALAARLLADAKAKEAAKKAAEEKKNAEKYETTKVNAIKAFDARTLTRSAMSSADEFYYALGWIVKHAGTVGAVLPDYLENAFTKYFGADVPHRVVDSKHRGPAGWQPQWSWSFTVSLKKPTLVPAFISSKLNPSGKAISDTSFVWDLVDNYGFQFGKKQDIDKIRSHVPESHLHAFEAGLIA